MKFFKLMIVVLVLGQLSWFVRPRTGSSMGESYRNQERIAAFKQSVEAPSPVTKASVDQELRLLDEHIRTRNLVVLACNLLADGILVFFCWIFSPARKDHAAFTAVPKKC